MDALRQTTPSEIASKSDLPYRLLFWFAAVYNVAFGLWAGLTPHSFFALFELPAPQYPSLWACLGMVVGLYGPVYGYIALHLDRGRFLALVGLVGKVLGPIGWLTAVSSGELPPRTFALILANDLIWWFPLLAYLLRPYAWRRAAIVGCCVFFNGVASVGLLAVRGGTEAVADVAARAQWIQDHVALWTAVWVAWTASSLGFFAFIAVWASVFGMGWHGWHGFTAQPGSHVLASSVPPANRVATLAACGLCGLGVLCDLTGESINVMWLTNPGRSLEEFAEGAAYYRYLGPLAANGLYCISGLLLSSVAWRTGVLRGWVGRLGFAMWTVGLALSVCAAVNFRVGMVACGAGVMGSFLPFAAAVAWSLRPRAASGGMPSRRESVG